MKCFQCGKNEALFSVDCLIVEHKVDQYLNIRTESERLCGATRAGLCKNCVNLATANAGEVIGPPALTKIAAASIFFGVALYLLGGRVDAPMVTAKMNLVRAGGLFLALAAGLFLFLRNVLAPVLLKRTPWKIVGHREGAILNLVAVGDGYYKDLKHFRLLNPYLSKKISEQIYRELIETGAWKDLLAQEEKTATSKGEQQNGQTA